MPVPPPPPPRLHADEALRILTGRSSRSSPTQSDHFGKGIFGGRVQRHGKQKDTSLAITIKDAYTAVLD